MTMKIPLSKDKEMVKNNDWPYNLLKAIGMEFDEPFDYRTDEVDLLAALAISHLTEREKFVLIERFFYQKTLKEVAPEIGTQQERVRQIEAKALRKMRHPSVASILIGGTKAHIEKLVNEKVARILSERQRELEEEYREKIANAVIQDDESKRDMIERLKATTVCEMGLSVRSFNCLGRVFVHDVGELMERYPTYESLMTIRNLGRKSLEEIVNKVQELGFNWPAYGENEDR